MTESKNKNPLVKWIVVHVLVIAALMAGLFALTRLNSGQNYGQTIWVVRHAEKITGVNAGDDPDLSEIGQKRAQILAALLANKNIKHIYSSNYLRTKNTAKPLAEKLKLDVEIYNPRKLDALASFIQADGQNALVVGHSNTIRETVLALGAKLNDEPINEAEEYDRLYIVTINQDGNATAKLKRFGVRYEP